MERRKNYFIDKQFQTKFIVKFCLINIAASLSIGVLIYGLNQQSNTVAFENLRVVVKSTADFIRPILLFVIIVVTVLFSIATVVVVLLTSHRISGPLYRLTVELEKIKNKDVSQPIRIRATDQLQRLASECEAMRIAYQRSIQELKKSWRKIQTSLQECEDLPSPLQEKRDLKHEMDVLASELDQFKTE